MTRDLVDNKDSDSDYFFNVWTDEELVFVQVDFLTYSLPKEEFKEFVSCVNIAYSKLLDGKNVKRIGKI